MAVLDGPEAVAGGGSQEGRVAGLARVIHSLFDRFLSDGFRFWKVLILAAIYLSLAFYFREASPDKGAQWQRVIFRAASAEAYLGKEVSLTHVIVGRVLDRERGAVLEVGWPKLEVTALGLKGVRQGDRVDLNGPFLDGATMGVSKLRIHRGSHGVKIWVSLGAALMALVIFMRAFRFHFKGGPLIRPRD